MNVGLGLIVPMKEGRRYNFEYCWGFGDIPERRVSMAVVLALELVVAPGVLPDGV